MPSSCASRRNRKNSRKNRKNSGKSRRSNRRNNMYGGEAPVKYSNPGPMDINLAQGQQFDKFHAQQHGGGALVGGPFPGAVTEGAFNPQALMASARQDPLIQAYAEIKQYGPSSDNPNLRGGKRQRGGKPLENLSKCNSDYKLFTYTFPEETWESFVARYPECYGFVTARTPRAEPTFEGGRRRKSRRGSRKSRKGSRKTQRGGDFVRWGGGRKGSRKYRGGAFSGGLNNPMPVADEGKMLIPSSLQQQAGLNPEWRLAENPMSFAPIAK